MKKLYLNEAMKKYQKKFKKGYLNLLNAPAGSGKTTFIFNELLKNTKDYTNTITPLDLIKDTVIYVCDTTMLKDSVLKDNSDITKVLGDKAITKMAESKSLMKVLEGNSGKVLVITYQSLGWLLKQPTTKSIMLKHCKCLILDEIHNLYKYAKRYNTKINEDGERAFTEDGNYVEIIDNLNTITKEILTIGVSATIDSVNYFYENYKLEIKIKNVFSEKEQDTLVQYNFNPILTNCIFNNIKVIFNTINVKEKGLKTLIYTNTIKQSKKYKEWFSMMNIKAEWLCSPNNSEIVETIDIETGEVITEKIPSMTTNQLHLREQLLNSGTLPKDLQVLIINGAYETGWNLKDDDIQIVFIDNTNIETQIQARNRIRHDIQLLVTTCKYDDEGYVLGLRVYPTHCEYGRVEIYNSDGSYYERRINIGNIKNIDSKYLGVKITKELKDEIVFRYAIKPFDKNKSVNFKNYCNNIIDTGYKVVKNKKGTFIYKEDQEVINVSDRGGNKVDNKNNLIDFIENKWDKSRITCNDVIDELDIGKKTFENIVKTKEIIDYMKKNRIKIGLIKGFKTKYMYKY